MTAPNYPREHLISVAPMMDRTDRHFRYFMRKITRRTLLYTEMVTTHALRNGARDRLLKYHPEEHPIALQLGGDNAEHLAECAQMAEDWGYDEVNINVGCPSDRVKSGAFGACLMAEPHKVARAVEAMKAQVSIPVTVKHRIGIDDLDRCEDMLNFVDVVSKSGADRFSVHARKAWLSGLSPKENRTVPPLRYPEVYRLKQERPKQLVEINGGIKTIQDTQTHLQHVDAVMIGRAAYEQPYLFSEVDGAFYEESEPALTRAEVVKAMLPYAEAELVFGTRLYTVIRAVLGLFYGVRGNKAFRRYLSEHAPKKGAGPEVLLQALEAAGC